MPHKEVLRTEEKVASYELPADKIDGGFICKSATLEVNRGVSSSANFAILDVSHRDYESSERLAIGNIGANFNVSITEGVDVGVDADVVRYAYEGENFKIGIGLSYSTGVKWQRETVKLHFMGYGFERDEDGFGVRVPILELKYKW